MFCTQCGAQVDPTKSFCAGVGVANQIVWRCGYGLGPDGAQFVSDQPGSYTTVARAYLPPACR